VLFISRATKKAPTFSLYKPTNGRWLFDITGGNEMSFSIYVTSSYRDRMTWRDYPNKEENDKFYDEHLAHCRYWGRKRGLMLAAAIYSAHQQNWKEQVQAANDVLVKDLSYTYLQVCEARQHILKWDFISRLRVADCKRLNTKSGKFPQDLWLAYWGGYKEALREIVWSPPRMPQEGELWRSNFGHLYVFIDETDTHLKFHKSSEGLVSINKVSWIAQKDDWTIV